MYVECMTHTRVGGVKVHVRMLIDYLCVGAHDLAGLLVECLTVPVWVQSLQGSGQAVVLAHKQRVN